MSTLRKTPAVVKVGNTDMELVFNLNVLDEFQEHYGDLTSMQAVLYPPGAEMPSIKALKWLLAVMANEATDIHNADNADEKRPYITEKQIGRMFGAQDSVALIEAVGAVISAGLPDPTEQGDATEDDSKNTEAAQG